jgi:hypothetical protein
MGDLAKVGMISVDFRWTYIDKHLSNGYTLVGFKIGDFSSKHRMDRFTGPIR